MHDVLKKAGISKICDDTSKFTQQNGPVNSDIDICLKAMRLISNDDVLFGVDRVDYYGTRIIRTAELLSIGEV